MEWDQQLEEYLTKKRAQMLLEHHRVLPSNELLFDRWEKAKLLSCGEDTSIYDTSVIMGAVHIGSNVWIGPYTLLEGLNGQIVIGDYCHVSSGVQIVTHDSVDYAVTGGKAGFKKGDVRIGSCTYIGGQSMIARNVTIGSHCVIGANSLVNKDIPDYCIAFGTPARVRGKVVIDKDTVRFEYDKKKPIHPIRDLMEEMNLGG